MSYQIFLDLWNGWKLQWRKPHANRKANGNSISEYYCK